MSMACLQRKFRNTVAGQAVIMATCQQRCTNAVTRAERTGMVAPV